MLMSQLLSQSARTLTREPHLLRKSLTHTATPVIGTTQRSITLFVGNSIPTNSKQKKCVVFVVVDIRKIVFP